MKAQPENNSSKYTKRHTYILYVEHNDLWLGHRAWKQL